jgi:hypothetical protein
MGARPVNDSSAAGRDGELKTPLTRPQLSFLMKAARPEGVISREFAERTVRSVVRRGMVRLSYRPSGATGAPRGQLLQVYMATGAGLEYLSSYKRVEHTHSPVHVDRGTLLAWARGMRTVLVALLDEVAPIEKTLDPTVLEKAARLVEESRPLTLRLRGG